MAFPIVINATGHADINDRHSAAADWPRHRREPTVPCDLRSVNALAMKLDHIV